MSSQAWTDPEPWPMLGESRRRVLDVLRAAGEPVGVQEIADRVGLHPNTARFHLDGLVDAGLADRSSEERSQPGRPRTVYVATATDVPAGQRSYRMLAEMLTSLIADTLPEPVQAAEKTGEEWGRYLADRPAPSQRVDAAEAVRRLLTVLADMGFAPSPTEDSQRPVIELRHCPFREVADQHGDVVCSLHLGLIRGVLAEVRSPLLADQLEPYAEPSLCKVHLAPAADGSTRASGRRTER
ncbi:MAG TPA: helix-turn-helix domain-containing protein [Pseudonocardiaceae bacterium]